MKLAQRIHLRQIETDAAYAELTAFLDRHRPCFDELTIFDGFCHHGAIPMNELRENAAISTARWDISTRAIRSMGSRLRRSSVTGATNPCPVSARSMKTGSSSCVKSTRCMQKPGQIFFG